MWILLDRPAMPDVAKLVERVGPIIGITAPPPSPPNTKSFVMVGGGSRVVAMMMDAPLPLDAYHQQAETAFWWPEAMQVVSRHKAHFIV